MKRTWLLVMLCMVLSLVSCNKKDDNIITYTSDDIYLNCAECGYRSGFPKELLIFESEEQLERALNEYEDIASLMDLDAVAEEYPIGEYVYLLQYFETDIDSKVECKGLKVNKEEMRIYFEHKIKSPKEGPAAITAYVTYAALPKEYLTGCDFSNQQGVLYLGKNAEAANQNSDNSVEISPTPVPTAGVAISEENFGDARFCDYLKEKFDIDKNGYFSDAELAEVTEIRAGMRNILTPYSEMKGFSYFPELKRLQLNSANKVEICDVPKLSEIELAGSNSEQTYLLGDVTIKNCPQLENIFIQDMKLLEEKEVVEFTVDNCPELRTMYLGEEGINPLNRMILKISGVPRFYLRPFIGYPEELILDTAAYQSIEFPVVDVVNMKIDNSGNSYITWVGDVTTEYREPLTELAELVKKLENGFFVEVQEVSPALYDEEGRKAYQVLVNNRYLSGDNYAINDVRDGYFVTYEEDAFVMYSDEPLTGDDFYFWWQELLTMPVDSYSPLHGVFGEFYGIVPGDDDDTRHGLAGYLMCRKEGDKQDDGGDRHNYGEVEVKINYSVTQEDGLRLWTKIDYDYDENSDERYVAEGIWLAEGFEDVTSEEDELPITQEYFSNLIFRDYLEEWVDLDRNGYLSVAEREEVTGIYARDYDMGPNVVDGFEFFPNLSKICIGTCEKLVCKNCPELRLIAIFGDAPEDAVIREGDAEVVTENCPKLEVIDTAMHPDVYWDNYLDW